MRERRSPDESPESPESPAQLPYFLRRAGEVGRLIAAHDWSSTLGPLSTWPHPLQAVASLILHAPTPAYLAWGPKLTMLYNDAYLDILGDKHPKALGSALPQTWPEVWPDIQPYFQQALLGQPVSFSDFPLTVCRNGRRERAYFSFAYTPLYDADGTVAGVHSSLQETTSKVTAERERLQDATERHEVQEALAKSEAKFRRVVEAGVIGIAEYRMSGELKEVNDAFLKIVGYTREDFDREGLSWKRLTPPEWLPANEKALEQLKSTGRMESFIKEYIRKNGTRATVHVGAANFEGTSDGGTAYIIDISNLKDAERALKESEARLRAITEAIPQIVWSATAQGQIDYANQQWYAFSGLDRGQAFGDGWMSTVHPDDLPSVVAAWKRSTSSGEPFEMEFRLRHASQGYRWILCRAVPVRDETGSVARWMGACTDIQEQKQTEEALRWADRQKDEFLTMLAHELRNPLAPIASAAHVLLLKQTFDPEISRIAGVISRQAAHMAALVDDLLDVSRVTRGLVDMGRAPVRIQEMVEEAVEQIRPAIAAKHHRLDINLPPEDTYVIGDRKRLVQVLSNLLENAAKYTPDSGHIVLDAAVTESEVTLVVRDNGIGMSEALQRRAFDLFAQGERTEDRSEGGLGIGLALVKKLTELHGGSVHAESSGLGHGSTFSVRLPRAHREAGDAQRGAESETTGAKGKTVMIVDDNGDAANMLAMYLDVFGYQPMVVNLPAVALEIAEERHPPICIIDIGLPQFSGYVLAQRLRSIPGMSDAVLVAVTGYGQPSDKERARSAGFDYHFVKPVDPDRLLAAFGHAARKEVTAASDKSAKSG